MQRPFFFPKSATYHASKMAFDALLKGNAIPHLRAFLPQIEIYFRTKNEGVREQKRAQTQQQANDLALRTYYAINAVLKDTPVTLSSTALFDMRNVAKALEMWKTVRPWEKLETPTKIVTANHYDPSNSALLHLTADLPDIETHAYQQSVVSSPCGFATAASKIFHCYGKTSATTIRSAFDQFHLPRPVLSTVKRSHVESCHHDRSGDILVLDQASRWAINYFGLQEAQNAFVRTIEHLASLKRSRSKIRIRPHPQNKDSVWKSLAQKFPGRILVSNSDRPLQKEAQGCSMGIGLFSTGLVEMARSGIPVAFLWEKGWFFTPDLEHFIPDMAFSTEELPEAVTQLLNNSSLYADWARLTRANADQYYAPDKTEKLPRKGERHAETHIVV